jgi:hypothetical protein
LSERIRLHSFKVLMYFKVTYVRSAEPLPWSVGTVGVELPISYAVMFTTVDLHARQLLEDASTHY